MQLIFPLQIQNVLLSKLAQRPAPRQRGVISESDPSAVIAQYTLVLVFGLKCVSETQ